MRSRDVTAIVAVPFTFKGRNMHYTIEDISDDEIQHIQDTNEEFYLDLEFPDPYDQVS